MKKIAILTICFTALFFYANGQAFKASGKIIYEEKSGSRIEFIEMYFNTAAYKYIRKQKPEDLFRSTGSVLSAEDSLANAKKQAERMEMLASLPSQTWYGQLNSSTVTNSVFINDQFYIVSDTLSFVTWEVLTDTSTINGLKCQRASGLTPRGVRINAWFTPTIPVTVAPYTLRGLPGLLVEAKYENGTVALTLLELEWPVKEDVSLAEPKGANYVSQTRRKEIMDKRNMDALKMAERYKKGTN